MPVNAINLSNPVLQDIETWTSVLNHTLGYKTVDRSTGKTYRYTQFTAGAATVESGMPAGAYVADADTAYSPNNVTEDASKALYVPIGIFRGSATSANIYGFIEELDISLPTTVLTSMDQRITQGEFLSWEGDGWLTSFLPEGIDSTEMMVSILAVALDSHLASKDQAGSTLTSTMTAVTVRWL